MFGISVTIAFLAKKMKQPYPIWLVLTGLAVGLLPVPQLDEIKQYVVTDEVFRTTIITIFLSALLGEASLKLPFSELKENKRPILLLAFGGTFLTFLIVGLAGYYILQLPLQIALVFGALMSATDPVSVLSIFKTMGLNKRLAILVEGESLANDGVAVVLFKIAAFSALSLSGIALGAVEFVKVIAGGLLIGLAFGYIASKWVAMIDDYAIEIGISIFLFYGSFLFAEHFHFSGVIAVVVAGLVLGTYGARIGMSELTRTTIDSFWDVVAFVANSVIFLMVGLEIVRIDFIDKWGMIALSIAIVLVARSIAIYTSLGFVKNISSAWKHVINWGGLKGSLSIALVLSLSPQFAGRDILLALTFANVLFSLIIQGLTVKRLVSFLGVK